MRDMKKRLDSRTIETYREMLHADGSAFAERFPGLHSNEQYQILRSFSRAEQAAVFEVISPEAFAQVFKWFSRRRQLKLYGIMAEDYRIRMLERLATDDTRRFIEPMEEADQQEILSRLSPTKRRYMEELLQYDQHSAGSIMRKEFVRGAPEDDVNMMVEKLKEDTTTYEAVHFVYVVDDDQQLVGLVALRDLLIAEDSRKLKEICDTSVHTVTVDMDQEQVAHIMQDYDIIAVPVVGADNELLGIITVDDIIDIMEFEATEDVGELTASRGTTDMDVSPFGAARKRAPWIMLLMGLGLITANVIGAFEETLESVVLLSFFIPLVMDAAGNTGTQSLAVMVRTISTGEYQKHGLWRTLGRELGAGVMVGAASGITIIILILVFYQELWLAFIVGISLLLTLSVATVIGTIMPIIISKLKIDPAVASGPFITTLNDIIGLFIYFSIATSLLQI
ncbi:magnesium transporter [Salinicoccus luteus]|uniref:magnesium transporter n=1 Tax=Salinicoccus luteus TaxID=367840 RepID=UPI0004E1C3A3|nr:magnesium transporter [Salinicoccus luteus]